MKKITKLFVLLFLPICFALFFVNLNIVDFACAEGFERAEESVLARASTKPSKDNSYSSLEYVIDKYHVDIKVGDNNVYHITEQITAYFNVDKHGIKRYIPIRNTIVRQDGSEHTYLAKIKNVDVNDVVDKDYNVDYLTLTIGRESKTFKGERAYTVSYTFDAGKDGLKGADEFYFNIIGTNWDTVIGNVSFSITMPSEFNASKLGFSHGSYGNEDSSGISYTVDENRITGSYNGVLLKNEGLTVRLELPEGYYSFKTSNYKYWYFIVPIVSALVIFIMWFIFGRDAKVIKTVEFYPPYDFNSVELAFNYKGKISNSDVSSMLVYLASKGYIKIIDNTPEDKKISEKSKDKYITLEKAKVYTGNNSREAEFIWGLFGTANKVTLNSISNGFYQSVQRIKHDVASKEHKREIFKTTLPATIIAFTLVIISALVVCMLPMLEYFDFGMAFGTLFLLGMFGVLIVAPLYWGCNVSDGRYWVFVVFWESMMILVAIASVRGLPIWLIAKYDPMYLTGFFVGIACLAVQLFGILYMSKRNAKGNEILGKILGFKQFLKTAEKDKLEALVNENPTYFYDILPYTYVLGVSKKWIEKFESIAIPPVEWYSGDFTDYMWLHSLNTTMSRSVSSISNTTHSQMSASRSSSSGGGGFSGGGFSGGGGGGGGGSSW